MVDSRIWRSIDRARGHLRLAGVLASSGIELALPPCRHREGRAPCTPRESSRCSPRSPARRPRRGRSTRSDAMALGSVRSEEHTSELQSRSDLVCRLLLEKKKTTQSGMSNTERRGDGILTTHSALRLYTRTIYVRYVHDTLSKDELQHTDAHNPITRVAAH